MKSIVKNGFYSSVWLMLIWLNSVSAAPNVTGSKDTTVVDTTWSFVATLDLILGYFIGLLYFIAVVMALYGWFSILTAGWDEEKVKTWKTTLINAVIGLVVIFLASQIITWAITAIWGLAG